MGSFCTGGVQKVCKKKCIAKSRDWMEIGGIWNHFLLWNFKSSTSLEICIVAKFWLQVRIFGNFWFWPKLQFANGARYSKIEQTPFVDLKNTRSFYNCQFFDPTHSFCTRSVQKCWKFQKLCTFGTSYKINHNSKTVGLFAFFIASMVA